MSYKSKNLFLMGLICLAIGVIFESITHIDPDMRICWLQEILAYYTHIILLLFAVWLWGASLWLFSLAHISCPRAFLVTIEDGHHLPHRFSHVQIWEWVYWKSILVICSFIAYAYLMAHKRSNMLLLEEVYEDAILAAIPVIPHVYCLGLWVFARFEDPLYLLSPYYIVRVIGRTLFPSRPRELLLFDLFWVDLFSSTIKIYSEFERITCRMYHGEVGSVTVDSACSRHATVVSVMSVLPYCLRLGQLMVQWRDLSAIKIIIIGVKCLTAFLAFHSLWYKHEISHDIVSVMYYGGTIYVTHALCSCYYELRYDWSLKSSLRTYGSSLRFITPHMFRHLLYDCKLFDAPLAAYLIISTNLILRLIWVYKWTPLGDSLLAAFVVTVLEMYRRFVWSIFRVMYLSAE